MWKTFLQLVFLPPLNLLSVHSLHCCCYCCCCCCSCDCWCCCYYSCHCWSYSWCCCYCLNGSCWTYSCHRLCHVGIAAVVVLAIIDAVAILVTAEAIVDVTVVDDVVIALIGSSRCSYSYHHLCHVGIAAAVVLANVDAAVVVVVMTEAIVDAVVIV